ncbi:MAG TPA: GDSL-type esterase/lipase family protein [Terrimicrobiaceae bacterium]|nr:GDSL-type esterase/lipase family protein [Terrimicrobiaceae bacterium]
MSAQRLICFGDSITHGKSEPEGFRWTAQLARELERRFPGRFEVYNRGVGGNTSAQAIERFGADVAPHLPGIVLIEFGFNDASVPPGVATNRVGLPEFQRNLREIVRLVRAGGGRPVLLVNHPIPRLRGPGTQGNGKDYAINFRPYQPAIRDVAAKTKAPVIDLESAMRRARVPLPDLLGADNLHLSRSGQTIYGRHVLDGLLRLGLLPAPKPASARP